MGNIKFIILIKMSQEKQAEEKILNENTDDIIETEIKKRQKIDDNEEGCETNIPNQEDNNTTSIINDNETDNITTENKEATEDKVEKLNIEENQTVEENKSCEV